MLSKEIGLKNNRDQIVQTILSGQADKVFIPKINQQYFSLMASVGLDAYSVKFVSSGLKKMVGEAAYIFSFLRQLFKPQKAIYNVNIDDIKYIASTVIVTNGKYYGGKYICAAYASIKEQKLYVILNKAEGRKSALGFFIALIRNKISECENVEIIPAKNVIITATECAPVQVDGDYFGDLPVTISSSENSINLVMPNS